MANCKAEKFQALQRKSVTKRFLRPLKLRSPPLCRHSGFCFVTLASAVCLEFTVQWALELFKSKQCTRCCLGFRFSLNVNTLNKYIFTQFCLLLVLLLVSLLCSRVSLQKDQRTLSLFEEKEREASLFELRTDSGQIICSNRKSR